MTSHKLDADSVTSNGRDFFSNWLIRHAARKAPPDLAERLQEEWRADMASRTSSLSRLRFALGCCWATQVIAYEHQPARAAATASSGGASALFAFSEAHGASFYSRRGSSFAVVLALHVAVFYALLTFVTHPHAIPEAKALVPRFLPKAEVPQIRPQTPPDLAQIDHRLPIAPPEVPPIDDGGGSVTTVVEQKPLPPHEPRVPDPPQAVKRVRGGAGAGFPNAQEFYPSKEIRLGHEGAADVTVCVSPNGKLTSQPAILKSSGFDGLDAAALRLAQAGSGHYLASTEDGRPVTACYPIRLRFQLRN